MEGKNIVIEWRYAEGKADRERELAAELVRLKVDIIVTAGPSVTRAAKEATTTIPIVFAQRRSCCQRVRRQPCATWREHHWIVNSCPGDSGKRLELLKEIVPKLSRVTVIGSSTEPGTAQFLKEMELAAGSLKVKLQYLDVLSSTDIETVFQAAAKGSADGVVMLGSAFFNTHRIQIVELAGKNRLPTTYARPEFVEDGGLMTYGPSINDLFRRAATYVDKILKGAKPADLPVEQAEEVRVVINLRAPSRSA